MFQQFRVNLSAEWGSRVTVEWSPSDYQTDNLTKYIEKLRSETMNYTFETFGEKEISFTARNLIDPPINRNAIVKVNTSRVLHLFQLQ